MLLSALNRFERLAPLAPADLTATYLHVAPGWEHRWSRGVTSNVYRTKTRPVPRQAGCRIASGLPGRSHDDSSGREGCWYKVQVLYLGVVTAVNANGESGPSNEARAERRRGGKGEGGMALGGPGGGGGEECPPGCHWDFALGECVYPPPPPPPPVPPEPVVRRYYCPSASSGLRLGSQRIALRISGDPDPANNGLFFFHVDHLDSTSLLSTITGTVAAGSEARFLPYGEYRVEPEADLTDHGFTGHKQQDAVGLIYMRARYYVPGVGRFINPDTVVPNPAVPTLLNRYDYAAGNPLKYTDPTGHYIFRERPMDPKDKIIQLPNRSPSTAPHGAVPTPFAFTESPVPLEFTTWTQGFGANSYAEGTCPAPCNADTHCPVGCYYRSVRGIHNGLDIGVPDGTVVVWTGNTDGLVYKVGDEWGDADPNVVIKVGDYYIVFGHLSTYDAELKGQTIPPGTPIGTTGEQHLHLGMRQGGEWGDFQNPLYFFPKEVADAFINDMGSYAAGEGPWSMVSFTNGTCECCRYFWGENGDTAGIVRP